jgi:nucleoside-diphosphate-sugar epimerase
MRIAITGGTGFVGSHLATRLRAEGTEVVVIGRSVAAIDDLDALACARSCS